MTDAPSAADDRALVAAAARRDPRAFAALYERHTPLMYGLALRLTGGSESDAEDVVHDAWVRAMERIGGFEWRSTLGSWLCGFVVLRWREVRRRRGRDAEEALDGNVVPDGSGSTAEPATLDARLDLTAERVDLERAVRRLASGYREVLVLHDVYGFTHEEIASRLGVEPGTSKSQLSRARRALRQMLAESGESQR